MNRSASLAELDRLASTRPCTNLRRHEERSPVIMVRSRGLYVHDVDGREFIEGLSVLWRGSLGFSGARLIAATTQQVNALPHCHGFAHKPSDVAIQVGHDLLQMAPGKMARVFFGTSGSDANDMAIKFVHCYNNARGRPKEKKFIARTKNCDGASIAAASLTGPGVLHTDCPHHYRFAQAGESEGGLCRAVRALHARAARYRSAREAVAVGIDP
jgi:4-aminobutyrate--pyruvate transaminase